MGLSPPLDSPCYKSPEVGKSLPEAECFGRRKFQGGLVFCDAAPEKFLQLNMVGSKSYLIHTGIISKALGNLVRKKLVGACLPPFPPNSFDHRILSSNIHLPGFYKKDEVQEWTSENCESLKVLKMLCLAEGLAHLGSQQCLWAEGEHVNKQLGREKDWWKRSPRFQCYLFLSMQRALPEYCVVLFCFSNQKAISSSHSFNHCDVCQVL